MTNTSTSVAVAPPSKREAALGDMEQFVLGCASGFLGAFISSWHLTGLAFVLYVILVPSIMLEMWESYILFYSPIDDPAAYSAHYEQTTARKCLLRLLFGQGAILGRSFQELLTVDSHATSRLTFYVVAWLTWTVVCQVLQKMPHEEEDLMVQQIHNQRTTRRRNKRQHLPHTRSNSTSSSHSSRGFGGSIRQPSETCVSIDLP